MHQGCREESYGETGEEVGIQRMRTRVRVLCVCWKCIIRDRVFVFLSGI